MSRQPSSFAFEEVDGWETLPEDVIDQWLQKRHQQANWRELQKLTSPRGTDASGRTPEDLAALHLHRRGW